MFRRFWMVLRSWLGAGVEKSEDPQLLLQQAQEEMRTTHAKNRLATAAITERNQLQRRVKITQRQIAIHGRAAANAVASSNYNVARKRSDEVDRLRARLEHQQIDLRQAEAAVEAVKAELWEVKRAEIEIGNRSLQQKIQNLDRLKREYYRSVEHLTIPLKITPAHRLGLLVADDIALLTLLLLSFLR